MYFFLFVHVAHAPLSLLWIALWPLRISKLIRSTWRRVSLFHGWIQQQRLLDLKSTRYQQSQQIRLPQKNFFIGWSDLARLPNNISLLLASEGLASWYSVIVFLKKPRLSDSRQSQSTTAGLAIRIRLMFPVSFPQAKWEASRKLEIALAAFWPTCTLKCLSTAPPLPTPLQHLYRFQNTGTPCPPPHSIPTKGTYPSACLRHLPLPI